MGFLVGGFYQTKVRPSIGFQKAVKHFRKTCEVGIAIRMTEKCMGVIIGHDSQKYM